MVMIRADLLKELLPKLNGAFHEEYETMMINKIIANEERSARYKKELEDAIQEQSR